MDFSLNSTRVRNQLVVPPSDMPLVPGLAPDTPDHSSLFDASSGSNEEAILNLSGRISSDKKEADPQKQIKLLRCSTLLKISTFNVRTLNGRSQINELFSSMSKQSIDIIAIQEHRIFHPEEELRYLSKSGSQLITFSATKNSIINATIGGVGLLLSSKACNNLTKIESISSRIMVAEFSSNPVLTVVCAYSPHNSSPEEEVDEFYTSLKNLLNNIPKHNFLAIAGDFNAKLAAPDVLFSYNKESNRNGDHLVNLIEEYDLFSSNNFFRKCPNHLWTFQYPNDTKAQIDYILFRRKWKNSVKDSRSYSSWKRM